MADRNDKSLARSLGQFVGFISRGFRADVSSGRAEVRRDVEEQVRETPQGRVTLRRTTIEEIELGPERGDGSSHTRDGSGEP